jgi:hypothetical protein
MYDITGIFTLSVVYGFTVCSLSCLPALSVYLMGTGQTFKDGLVGGFYFVAGKMLVYGTWGGLAGGFGMLFGVPTIQRLPLLLLGASTSLVPCPPLIAILLLAAHKGSVLTGISYGLVFGSGLIVSPLMAAGGSMALISGVIKQKVSWIGPYLQGSAMVILLFMGMRIFLEV